MAQYAQNSSNYHGARSKTNFNQGKSKKDKKKHNEAENQSSSWDTNNSWDAHPRRNRSAQKPCDGEWKTTSRSKRRDATDCWGDEGGYNKRKESKTIWDDIEQDFPSITPSDTGVPQINVWEQRQQKFEELKTMEPSNEDEEENMIRRALELSKLDITQEERRKQIEEEYRLQEELLRNNPSEFSEFLLTEESGAAAATENFSSVNGWNPTEYAPAVGNDDASQSVDNWDNYSFSDTKNSNSYSKNSSQYQNSDGWDDYSDASNKRPQNRKNRRRALDKHENWDDCNSTENKYSASKQSENKSSGIWDTYEVEKDQNSNFSAPKEKHNTAFEKELEGYSEGPNRRFNKSLSKTVDSETNISKVVSMFGGWGSTSNSTLQTDKSSTSEAKIATKEDNKLSLHKSDCTINSKPNKTTSLYTEEGNKSKTQVFESKSKETVQLGFAEKLENNDSKAESFRKPSTNYTSSSHKTEVCDSSSFQDINNTNNNIINEDGNVADDQFKSSSFENETNPTNSSNICSSSSKYSSESSDCPTDSSTTKRIINNKDTSNKQTLSLGSTEDPQTLPNLRNHQKFDNAKPNIERCSSPVPIDPPKPVDSFQSTELLNGPNSTYQPMGSVEYPTPTLSFSGTENKFQESVPGFQKSDLAAPNPDHLLPGNIPSPMQPFSYATPSSLLPLSLNPMIGAVTNPNMFAGVDPIQMQYMLMLQNPYFASNLQTINMYYRSIGLNIGPLNMAIPPMLGLSAPTLMNPNNNPQENPVIHPPVPISKPVIKDPVINPPTYSSINAQKPEQSFSNNSRKSVNNNLTFPEFSKNSNQSIIDSFLPRRGEFNEISIPPPVMQSSHSKEDGKMVFATESSYEKGAAKFTSATDNLESTDMPSQSGAKPLSAAESLSSLLSACSNLSIDKDDAASEASECIGWGELDKTNVKKSFNKWDEETDGWNDNYTTKSIGNPSNFDSKKKSVNRQPSRQPNFNRFRK